MLAEQIQSQSDFWERQIITPQNKISLMSPILACYNFEALDIEAFLGKFLSDVAIQLCTYSSSFTQLDICSTLVCFVFLHLREPLF